MIGQAEIFIYLNSINLRIISDDRVYKLKLRPCLPMIKIISGIEFVYLSSKQVLCLGPESLKFACSSHSTQAGTDLKV